MENKLLLSEQLELDIIIKLAKIGYPFYQELLKKIDSLIKYNTPQNTITEFFKNEIQTYCNNEQIINHYEYMLKLYDSKYSKENLSFDEILIKPFFNCYTKIDENNKKSYIFEVLTEEKNNEILYISHRMKEKNAWKDFIKNWWHKDDNYKIRIECYLDIYSAIKEFENSKE